LENDKIIDGNSKKSHEKTVQQEKTKFLRIEARRQYVAKSKKYLVKMALQETGPKVI